MEADEITSCQHCPKHTVSKHGTDEEAHLTLQFRKSLRWKHLIKMCLRFPTVRLQMFQTRQSPLLSHLLAHVSAILNTNDSEVRLWEGKFWISTDKLHKQQFPHRNLVSEVLRPHQKKMIQSHFLSTVLLFTFRKILMITHLCGTALSVDSDSRLCNYLWV